MKKKLILLPLITALIFLGCTADETIVKIVRTPLLSFDFDAASSWKADDYSFAPVSKVVVYPEDTTQSGQLFNRLTLEGSGKDSMGDTYQLIITFDAADMDQLSGVYSPLYTAEKGLFQIELYNLTNNNDLSAYSICNRNSENAIFEVQKQNKNERLITGNFHMTLCNSRDTTEKIKITNGILKDIKY